MRPISDSTVLVTGATDGLGKAVAMELAGSGAAVLLHGRDESRGEETLAEIRRATGNDRLRWYRADLASLGNVRELAEHLAAEQERLDVLVNNAGIGTASPGDGGRLENEDGYELRFAVNYLAPFLLTRLLEPLLVASAPARIVNVSSAGQAVIDFDDVMLERSYDGVRAYCQSKLALVMLTFDLADEFRGRGVTANCLHPGSYMPTKMVRAAGVTPIDSLETGVRATTRLIAAAELDGVSGRYFDRGDEARAHPQAYDPGARKKLRELSERLVGLTGGGRRFQRCRFEQAERITGEETAFGTLTLLLAVCEQALASVAALDPRDDGLVADIERLQTRLYELLGSDRFAAHRGS